MNFNFLLLQLFCLVILCSSMDNSTELSSNYQTECQVKKYLQNAKFPDNSLSTMVCISKYESSFNCDASNINVDNSKDYGLFQINSYYWCSGGPESKYDECNTSCESLYSCQKNANCAYKVWKQQGYNAWYGYKSHRNDCDNYVLKC